MALPTLSGIGRLTQDPTLRYTSSGVGVCQVNLAFNSRRKNQAGEWEDDKVLFLRAEAWRETAEAMAELSKGALVVVTGDVETEQWTTKDGEKRSAAKLNLRGIGRVLQEQGAARATRSPAPADDPFGSAPVADEAPF
jgi:single-strand DNA-binding protein